MEHYPSTQSWHSRRHSTRTYGFSALIFELLDMLLLLPSSQLHSYPPCSTRTDAKSVIYTLFPVTDQSSLSIFSTQMGPPSALCHSTSCASRGTSRCEPAECATLEQCKVILAFPAMIS